MSTKHPLGRPPKRENPSELERLAANGRWVKDDGKPGMAFSGRSEGFPIAWGPDCDCGFSDTCPRRKAMHRTAQRFCCANGRRFRVVRRRKPALSLAGKGRSRHG